MKTVPRLLIVLALLIFLPVMGVAQDYYTLPQVREQAKDAWQQTYTAHGREIVVDVVPHVPAADQVPMVQYTVEKLAPTDDPMGRWTLHEAQGMPGSVMIEADLAAVTRNYDAGNIWHGEYDMQRQYIPGNPHTLGQIMNLLRGVLKDSGLGPDLLYLNHPFSVQQAIYKSANGVQEAAPGMLVIEIYQSLRGLPLVGDPYKAFLYGAESLVVPGQTSSALVLSPSQFVIFVQVINKEVKELASDLPLASFGQVVSALEGEINAGRLRQVFQMTLGYAMFADKGNKMKEPIDWNAEDTFYACPVWSVDCMYVEDARKKLTDYSAPQWAGLGKDLYNTLEYKRLLVNAQTGKLIDPASKSAYRMVHEGFLSWEDVGGR